MAALTKRTIQKLAVLHALSLWRRGAYGPVRLQKTLFFADKDSADQKWRLFTFKRWHLGQYSDDVSNALNSLQSAERINTHFDGPSQRIEAVIPAKLQLPVRNLFRKYFEDWNVALEGAFEKWAHLNNDQILVKAHDDPTYKQSQHGQIIAKSALPAVVEFTGLDEDVAESLTDAVDPLLTKTLRSRLLKASVRPPRSEDWRSIYFGEDSVA